MTRATTSRLPAPPPHPDHPTATVPTTNRTVQSHTLPRASNLTAIDRLLDQRPPTTGVPSRKKGPC